MPLFVVIKSTYEIEFAFYVGFGIIFSIGWAAIQISHMSLVPSLTLNRKRRDRLNNLRNFFTFASNLIVLGLGLIIFTTVEDNEVGFVVIASFALLLGMAASIFFLCIIKES
jgi:Na+/melibiose symporter-like transporter